MFTENANRIFNRSIEEYHRWDDVDHPIDNPYAPGTIDHLLYHKNWIDTVQWHLEDIIRDPAIDPAEALLIKRRIDLIKHTERCRSVKQYRKINCQRYHRLFTARKKRQALYYLSLIHI